MPSAQAILFTMSGFLGLWGLSLVWRGAFGERTRRGRVCPSCDAPVPVGRMRCEACGYESERERDFRARHRSLPLAAGGAVAVVAAFGAFMFGLVVQSWFGSAPMQFTDGWGPIQYLSVGVLGFALVLAAWGVAGERPRGRRRCPKCWYDMSALATMRCPECGHEADSTRRLYKPRRRWRAVAAAVLIALGGVVGMYELRYRRGGWVAVVPTTLLIAGLHHWPDEALGGGVPGAQEDWSLRERVDDERLWGWQSRWLDSRCRRIVQEPHSTRVLRWALEFLTYDDPINQEPLTRFLAGAICARDQKTRSEAASIYLGWLVVPMSWTPDDGWVIETPDIAEFETGLTGVLNDADPSVGQAAALLLMTIDDDPIERLRSFLHTMSGPRRSMTLFWAAAYLATRSPRDLDAVISFIEEENAPGLEYVARGLIRGATLSDRHIDRLLGILGQGSGSSSAAAAYVLCHATDHRRGEVFAALLERCERETIEPALYVPMIWDYHHTPLSPEEQDAIREQMPRLLALLDHEDAAVVENALAALTTLPGNGMAPEPEWIAAVERCSRDHDGEDLSYEIDSALQELRTKR